jgi:hypothetical protein
MTLPQEDLMYGGGHILNEVVLVIDVFEFIDRRQCFAALKNAPFPIPR